MITRVPEKFPFLKVVLLTTNVYCSLNNLILNHVGEGGCMISQTVMNSAPQGGRCATWQSHEGFANWFVEGAWGRSQSRRGIIKTSALISTHTTAHSLRMLPEKTYQLLQNNTVHQVLGLSAVSTGCIHKSLTDLEGRGVNQRLRLVPLFLTLNRIMWINSNLPPNLTKPPLEPRCERNLEILVRIRVSVPKALRRSYYLNNTPIWDP